VQLAETIAATGLHRELSMALRLWRKPLAIHDPAKVITDLALCLALGGDTPSDVALLRAEPGLNGSVASDPTVSRTIAALAAVAPAALRAINAARAAARKTAWRLAGEHAPDHEISAKSPLIIDVDATLVTSHSDKEQAAPTFKRGYGLHPLCAFFDHGADGSGEPLALMLRAGNAGSNTAADHITVIKDALRQLPGHVPGRRPGRKVLMRTDGAGCTHDAVEWMPGQRLSYSLGFTLLANTSEMLALIPEDVWQPADDAHDQIRDGPGPASSPTCST
jgi:hypothetical protein